MGTIDHTLQTKNNRQAGRKEDKDGPDGEAIQYLHEESF
jgi:hypothetical protein